MSVKVMNAVFDRFPEGGGLMVLALKLADHAHDDGTHIFPSVEALAQKTRQSGRTVQRQLEKMVKAGWLIPVSDNKGGRGLTNEYRISPEWLGGNDIEFAEKGDILSSTEKGDICDEKGDIQSRKGDIHDKKGDTAMSPEPSVTTKNNQESKTKGAKSAGSALVLPDWMPAEAWAGYLQMRKAIKKPMTPYAMKLAIEKLAELRAEGNDPVAVLNESIMHSWQGLFPLKSSAPGVADLKTRTTPRVNQMPQTYGKSGRL